MSKFKIGDKVVVSEVGHGRCRATYVIILLLNNGLLKCKRIDDRNNTQGLECAYRPEQLELMVEAKVDKSKAKEEYSFKVKHTGLVNPEEINISREYPIAIISSRGQTTLVYFHGSIIIKAGVLGLLMPKYEESIGNNAIIECYGGEAVGEAVEGLKSILKAPWDSKGIEVSVKLLGVG